MVTSPLSTAASADKATPAGRTGALHRGRAKAIVLLLSFVAGLFGTVVLAPGAADARPVSVHGRSSYEASIARSVLRQLNAERRAHHLKPLHSNSHLQLSARRHDITMSRFNTMSHQLPHEAFFASRIRSAGYKWKWAGENIAWNSVMTTAGARQLQAMMYNERPPNDGHRVNILSSHFRDVGVDVYLDRVHHKVWLTTDFGRK